MNAPMEGLADEPVMVEADDASLDPDEEDYNFDLDALLFPRSHPSVGDNMLPARTIRRLIAETFSGTETVDITTSFTKRRHRPVLTSAVKREGVLHVIRHTKTTDWLFRRLPGGYDCMVVFNRVIAKAQSQDLALLKPLFSRLDCDSGTACCICTDDLVVEDEVTPEVMADVCSSLTTGDAGVCCSQYGNYVCQGCLKGFSAVNNRTLPTCPICCNAWLKK